jgi:hypothetical protein
MRICAKAICTKAHSNEGEIMQKRKCAKIAFDRKFAQPILPLEKNQFFLRYMCRGRQPLQNGIFGISFCAW